MWNNPAHETGVKDGCYSTKSCDSSPCPAHSLCVETWRSYRCDCDPGYIGDQCLDICLMNPCSNNATCVHDHHSLKGYDCRCPNTELSGKKYFLFFLNNRIK